MDTRQLQTLLAIVQHGGFAAAARAVHLTASAVSQQIGALEEEIGAPLFDRSRRPPALTAKGAEMVRSARTILQLVNEAKAAPGGGAVRGTLAIGSLRTGAQSILPRALAMLRPLYPDLTFRMRIGMSEELMNEVATGQLDAALVADHVAVPPSLYWTEVVKEMLVVITPPGTRSRSLAEVVRTIPYIRYRTQVPLARQIDTEIARLGAAPEQVVSVNTMTSVIGCVQAGLGFAVVPYAVLQDAITASLGWFPFGHPPIHRRLGIVQSPHSTRGEVLVRLSEAVREAGRPRDDRD
ncbi:LysR family transcriptional regulator [Maritimibacter alkaliphilus]|uniref:LysR family transcriptional regulator n=1 Tax=Maritimibacter alkaliphilus TaxID=404236 RepID=UPI001C95C191|nr:LysR substrate-binding domain-containing protein [Maritimibacter alkaliphilus]MBY6092328.1 LysR family transcriptional regulator [Maritimibacter alkaliphilus]